MRPLLAPTRLIWAVLCAVWFAALAPSVSALLASQGRVWVEVCTTTGSQWRLLDKAQAPDDGAHTQHKHCPYCLLQQDQATPPDPFVSAVMLPTLQERQRWQIHALPYQAVAWAQLPSRAPPASFV